MSVLDRMRALARADAATVPRDERNEIYEQTPSPTGLSSFNSFVSLPENVERAEVEERATLIEFGAGVPKRWAEGYAALCAMPPPAGFSSKRWQRVVDAAGGFFDRWAAAAIAAGWSELDLFGVDRDRPTARFDCMGLLMLLDHVELAAIDAEGADLRSPDGAVLRYRRRPLPAHTVSLWELAR
jgi:hypothetical protein